MRTWFVLLALFYCLLCPKQQCKADEHQHITDSLVQTGDSSKPSPSGQTTPGVPPKHIDPSQEQNRAYSQKPKMDCCEVAIKAVISNWPLIIIYIVGTCAAIKTFRAFVIQIKEMNRQTVAMRIAADASQKSAEALINSERAWILVDIPSFETPNFDPERLQIFWIFPAIMNHGRSVARIKRVKGALALLPEGNTLPAVPEYPRGPSFDDRVDILLPPKTAPLQPHLPITAKEWQDVQDSKISLFVYGLVEYFDGVSKTQRLTSYCLSFVIKAGYSPAETGFYPYLKAPKAYTECT
jgi:hypothetical protein